MKPERIPWKESNLAAIGSDLDHKIKQAAAEGEEAWRGVKDSTGLRVWRIEKFQVKAWPEDKYGTFYTGDSYIVMNTYQKPDSEALNYDVHICKFLFVDCSVFVCLQIVNNDPCV